MNFIKGMMGPLVSNPSSSNNTHPDVVSPPDCKNAHSAPQTPHYSSNNQQFSFSFADDKPLSPEQQSELRSKYLLDEDDEKTTSARQLSSRIQEVRRKQIAFSKSTSSKMIMKVKMDPLASDLPIYQNHAHSTEALEHSPPPRRQSEASFAQLPPVCPPRRQSEVSYAQLPPVSPLPLGRLRKQSSMCYGIPIQITLV